MTAPILAGAWVAFVLAAAWRCRPHRPARRPERPGSQPVPALIGRGPALGVVDRVATATGRVVLGLLGASGSSAAPRVGRTLLTAAAVVAWSRPAAVAAAALAWWAPALVAARGARRRAAVIDGAVPELAELLLVAVGAGTSPRRAVQVSADHAPPPLRGLLAHAGWQLARGASLDEALRPLAEVGPAAARLHDVLTGATVSGSPVAATLTSLAADGRRERRQRAQAAARRLPVLLLFPLTFCILPAFGLLTVGPALASGLRALQP